MEKDQLFEELIKELKKRKLSAPELGKFITHSLPRLYEEVLSDNRSYVIKRDGRLEEFDCDKLESSLASASDEARHPLASSELKIFCEDVKKETYGKARVVHTWQLRDTILEKLYKNKYYEIYKIYNLGRKSP